jgi:hypothetical protein
MFENDTYSYKGWLTSDYFLKRAFGALLYQMAAGLVVYGIIMVLVLVIIFAVFVFGIAGMT